jgi:predicted RNA methylase
LLFKPSVQRLLLRLWGNPAFRLSHESLSATLSLAKTGPPVRSGFLELGTGVSTPLLAVLARESGSSLIAVDNDPDWIKTISRRLRWAGLANKVEVVHAPIKQFPDFDWYDPAFIEDQRFSLVLCDGPIGSTRGGRYGAMEFLYPAMVPGASVLVDDYHRPEEARMVKRWTEEHGLRLVETGPAEKYAVLEKTQA